MAGIVNRQKKKDDVTFCDIVLDGGIHSTVKATLVKELIKYFMYERQQMPVPFDNLKKEIISRKRVNPEVQKGQEKKQRLLTRQAKEEKKKSCLVLSLNELMHQLDSAFHVYPELDQVMVVLGNTIISPKESYRIHFPPPTPEAESLTEKKCIKSLFRQLITQDMLGGMKPISLTNLSVMLYAPRNSGITWFKPKPTFKTISRGKQFVYNVKCTGHVGSHDMSCDVNAMEISGVEPLECSSVESDTTLESTVGSSSLDGDSAFNSCDTSESMSTGSTGSLECTVLNIAGQMDTSDERVVTPCQTESEIIWFQSPVFVKGYREKLSAN